MAYTRVRGWNCMNMRTCGERLATQSRDRAFCGRYDAFCARLVAEHTFRAFSHLLPLFGALIRRPRLLSSTCRPRALHARLYVKALAVVLRCPYGLGTPLHIHIPELNNWPLFNPFDFISYFVLPAERAIAIFKRFYGFKILNFWRTLFAPRLGRGPASLVFGTHIAEFNYRHQDIKAFPLATLASTLQTRARGRTLLPETDTSKVLPKARPYLLTNG